MPNMLILAAESGGAGATILEAMKTMINGIPDIIKLLVAEPLVYFFALGLAGGLIGLVAHLKSTAR